MKKKLLLALTLAFVLSLLLIVSVNAEVTIYDDAPTRNNIQIKTDEIIEFDDGFKCPSAYVFKDVTSIGYNGTFEGVMDFEYISGKRSKTYTYANVKGFDVPTGFTSIGQYAGRDDRAPTWITFPNTVTSFGNAIFQSSTTLEYCELKFDESNPLRKFPPYMFYGCANLKAFSMPDCFTEIFENNTFTGCTTMKAVYLSKNLTTWNSGGGGVGGATFDNCYEMYFVNEPFSLGSVPEKPEIYYFPANLQNRDDVSSDFSVQSVMRNCYAINSTVVFGEKVTKFKNEYFFQGAKVNVVFLGDMDAVAMGNGNWYKTTYYFANPADKSTDDVTISTYSASKAVFCNAEGNTTHLFEKSMSTDATCTAPKMTANYCFCGTIIGEPTTEGEALGHLLLDENAYYTFTGFLVAGNKNIDCARGDCDHTEVTALESAVFTSLGYSVKEYGVGGKCFTNGYKINNEALDLYESTMGVKVGFGFGFNRADRFATEGEVTLDSFTISGYAKRPENDREFGAVEYKMTYENSETLEQDLAKDIVIAFYVVEVNNETGAETLTFVNKGEGAYNGFEAISYLGAAELAK